MTITLNATVTAGEQSISWDNEVLKSRKVLDGVKKIYTSEKSLVINEIEYSFKYYIYYNEEKNGWLIGCEYSPALYSTTGTPGYYNGITWSAPITETVTKTSTRYTDETLNTQVLFSVTITI